MKRSLLQMPEITSGPMFLNMLRFFVPIMLGTLLQLLYSTIDAIILGKFVGKTALAAVGGSAGVLVMLIVGFFVAMSSGASVVISQHAGAGDEEQVSKGVHTAVLLAIVTGGIMMLLGMVGAPLSLKALKTPQDTMQFSVDYLVWYFAGMIPMMIYNMGSAALRALGDSRRPLYFLAVCVFVNIALDLLFVAVFHMQVMGAALATTLSQIVCATLVWRTLTRLPGYQRLELKKLRFDRQNLSRMLYIGLPTGVQSAMYSVTNVIVQVAINKLGTDIVAAWTAVWKLDGLFWPISEAIGITIMTFVGQNYGAKNRERIFRCIHAGLILEFSFAIFYSLLIYFTRNVTIRLFNSDTAVVAEGVEIVEMIIFFYPAFCLTEVFSAAMRGVGDALKPTLLTLFGICVLRIIILLTITLPHTSNATIVLCYPVTWITTSVLFLVYYKSRRWMPEGIRT